MVPWSSEAIILAFGGGVFGASLGGLWSFCLCGFVTLFGCLLPEKRRLFIAIAVCIR